MSSVHRQPGRPCWFCAFYNSNGKRVFRSTGTAKKTDAVKICNAWAKAAKLARRNTLTQDRARAIIEAGVLDILEDSGVEAPRRTVEEFFNLWIEAREKVTSPTTFSRYSGVIKSFLTWMGTDRRGSISNLTMERIEDYRAYIAKKSSASNVNVHLKVLRVALKKAVPRYLSSNPASHVENLDMTDRNERRPFTMQELKDLLEHASRDWRTMILIGLYTGFRLADCASLTWANLDMRNREFVLRTQKTDRVQRVPIHKALMTHLESLPAGDDPKASLAPSLVGKIPSRMSNEFFAIMVSAGIVQDRDHSKVGQGRDTKRRFSEVSFHSLRHTATSLLKNAGVSEAVTMDLIGHESAAISRNYTTIDGPTKRDAIDKMPDITR